MKYIKTEQNIFEVIEETELVYKVIGASRNIHNVYSKSKCCTNVIQSSDFIEDLLDGFVVENTNDKTWFFMDISEFKNQKTYLIDYVYIGFIKTNDGFKYVAKLDEKGILKLC